MRSYTLTPEDVTPQNTVGRVLTAEVVGVGELGRVKLGKGHILGPEDVNVVKGLGTPFGLIEMEPGDIHEDEASGRLARAMAGEGVELRPPVESVTLLRAAHRGLVEVNADVMLALNLIPDISVYTVFDGQLVSRHRAVGAAKVTPLVVPGTAVEGAEGILRESGPIIAVHPFTEGAVGILVRERLNDAAKAKFESAIRTKVEWFGGTVAGIAYCGDNVAQIESEVRAFLREEVTLILAAGVNSTDPLDSTLLALEAVGATVEKRGVPAHPGSTCWLSYADAVPIFGLGLCGMFSQTTVMDLLLPRFMSGQHVTAADLARLGHGGMLTKEMGFRFPDYTRD